MKPAKPSPLYRRIREILESARANVARSVNSTQVVANWLIGREIVEEEQRGHAKADYGARLLSERSNRLQQEYGNGYSVDNLELFRRFYLEYPALISDAARWILPGELISDAARRKLAPPAPEGGMSPIRYAARSQSCRPGLLNPNLSWTHYRTLLRVEKPEARAFYERYTLGAEQKKTIFASRYKLHLPTEAELESEIRKEMKSLRGGGR